MVYSSKDSNHVDFCRDSAKYASIMAFAAPRVENLLIKAIMQGRTDYERSALLACCHRIQKSRPVGMKSDQASLVGRSVMGAMPSVGRRNSNWMSGMWIMYP